MTGKKLRRSISGIIAVAILAIGVVAAYPFSFGKYEKVKAINGVFAISTAKLSDGNAHFYKFGDGGKDIAFFVVKSADGSFKAAFDACDACYKSKKGYEKQGDKMNCRNCNQKFAIGRLGPNATGGCNPGYLPTNSPAASRNEWPLPVL